jgi:hypothetical protein
MEYRFRMIWISAVCAVVATVSLNELVATGKRISHTEADYSGLLTPWQCIGGCGAGGSGGGSSGIKWIGEGVSGGLLELEFLPKANFGRTFSYTVVVPRLTFTPIWNTEVGIALPIGTKISEVQYQTNMSAQTFINGGRGDLSVDFMKNFGSIGQYSIQFGITFPTGQYDAERGPDLGKSILPYSLQMGQGTYSTTLALYYTRDFDNGMSLFDANFNYPFMFRFNKKNQYLETDYKEYKNATENRERFYYKYMIKPYGESDRGDYFPPSISLDAIYAYRGVPKLTQSFQFLFMAPLGVRWIHSYVPTEYNPLPDPDHRAWDLVFSYCLEFSRERFPLFLGTGLPIHDRKDQTGKWDAPDWKNIGNEWIFAFGFKVAMF